MKTILLVVTALGVAAVASAQRLVPSHEQASPGGTAVREVARVNGVPIGSDRLDAAVNALIPMQSYHRQLTADRLAAYRQQALDGLIDEELQHQRALTLRIDVTGAEIDADIAGLRTRYGSAKAFDQARTRAGVSMEGLRAEVRRRLLVQKIATREVTSRCEVTAAETLQYFQANPDRFTQPEQLHVYAITIGVPPSSSAAQWADAKSRAENVLRLLRNGASFEETAREYSTDDSRKTGGDMGFVHRGSLNEEFEAALKDLPPGQTSEVVQTLYGYHIVRVTGVRPPLRKSFEEVSGQLRKDLTSRRCEDLTAEWLRRLRAEAAVVVADLK